MRTIPLDKSKGVDFVAGLNEAPLGCFFFFFSSAARCLGVKSWRMVFCSARPERGSQQLGIHSCTRTDGGAQREVVTLRTAGGQHTHTHTHSSCCSLTLNVEYAGISVPTINQRISLKLTNHLRHLCFNTRSVWWQKAAENL